MEKDSNGWPLPSEITLHILSFLRIKDLCVLDQVASFFHNLCELDELWLPFVSDAVVNIATRQKMSCRLVMRCLHARWDGKNCTFGGKAEEGSTNKKKFWGLFSRKQKKIQENEAAKDTEALSAAGGAAPLQRSGDCVNLALCGGGGIGAKTALVIQFIHHHFMEACDPTIEDSYRKRIMIKGKAMVLDILDCAGQEEYTSLRPNWFTNRHGYLLGYDVTSPASLEELYDWREGILEVLQCGTEDLPAILVGNKIDLETQRRVSTMEGKRLAAEWGIPFFETSAKTRINVEECFHKLVREVWRREEQPKKSRAGEVTNGFGSTFKGTLDSQGRPSGHGICFLSEQQNPVFERFEGFWEKGVPAGNGKFVSRGGVSEEISGKWRKGKVSLHFIRFKEEEVTKPKRSSFLEDV